MHETVKESFAVGAFSGRGNDHLTPFHCSVRLLPSAPTQNVGLAQDRESMNVCVSLARNGSTTLATDQWLPFHVATTPAPECGP